MRQMNGAITDGEPIMSAAQRLELVQQSGAVDHGGGSEQSVCRGIRPGGVLGDRDPAGVGQRAHGSRAAGHRHQGPVGQAGARSGGRARHAADGDAAQGGQVAELTEHASTGVWSGWLSNNVRFHYRFMDTRKNDVAVRISLIGGELHETAENRGVTQAATIAWAQPATAHLSSSDIRSLMTGKKVAVRRRGHGGGGGRRGGGGMGRGNTDSISLTVSGSPEDLESGMQLAHLLLTEPKVEPAAFTQVHHECPHDAAASRKQSHGGGHAGDVGAPYPADVARTQPLTIEQLDRLDVAAAQAQLDRLIRTSPIEVAVVGDLPQGRALGTGRPVPRIACRRANGSAPTLYADLRKLERPPDRGDRTDD